jgi:uncharacterized protein DUF1206
VTDHIRFGIRIRLNDARAMRERFVRSAAFEILARAGFVARAVVYGLVGALALGLGLALGEGGEITNQQGTFETIARQPFGRLLLSLLAAGLAGYALWALVRAAVGHGPDQTDSAITRIGDGGSGFLYGALCYLAIEVVAGARTSGSGSPRRVTAGVLGWPGGTWLVGIAGLTTVGIAIYQGYRAVTRSFLADVRTEQMSSREQRWITASGTLGHLARMVVFALVGVFLVKAALTFNPANAIGLDGALTTLLRAAYGPSLLGIVSAGLVAFALYSLGEARYRRL